MHHYKARLFRPQHTIQINRLNIIDIIVWHGV